MMNSSIEQLFERIKSSDENVQNHAIAELWMLLEQSIYPGRNDETSQVILPDDLLGMRLSIKEIKVVIECALTLAESNKIPRNARISLMGIIALFADVGQAESLLRFFSGFAETFDEQQAYSFIASLGIYLLRIESLHDIYPTMVKYNTIKLLKTFQKNPSEHLQEAVMRELNYLHTNGINTDS